MYKLLIVTALTLTACSAPAHAESNQSNASGFNTTSFTGTPGSIWEGDRKVIVTPNPTTKVQPVLPKVEPVLPKVQPVLPKIQPAKPKPKPVYKPAKYRAPKARG